MQAVQTARHLRDRIDRAMKRGNDAYARFKASNQASLGDLLQAAQAYGAAWELADTACSIAPARDYTRLSDQRDIARQNIRYLHEIAAGLGLRVAA